MWYQHLPLSLNWSFEVIYYSNVKLTYFLNLFSVVVTKHHDQKQFWKERIHYSVQLYFRVYHWGKWGKKLKENKNLETKVDPQATEKCCLLACCSWLAQSAFICNPQRPAHRYVKSGLGHPTYITNLEKYTPQTCL